MANNENGAKRLRDRREPGHLWMDNEIYDVFGEALGQNGISVYGAMCRYCYGTEVRLSLREIAAAARMGKDTVARSMKVLVALGLVIETKGAKAKTVSTWALANVKALVQEYVRHSVSPHDRLIAAKTEEAVSAARHSTLVQMITSPSANCLTERQMDSQDKKICVAQNETDLSQKEGGFETDLSHQQEPLINKTQDTRLQNKNIPLPPSKSKGVDKTSAEEAQQLAETQALPGLIEWRMLLHRILAPLKTDLYQTDLNLGTRGRQGLKAGAQDWKDCFESLALVDYREEAGRTVLVLQADDAQASRVGLSKYANRIQKYRQAVVDAPVDFQLVQRE